MPITVSQLILDKKKIEIPLSIGTLSVTYYPSKLTEKTIYAMLRFQNIDTAESFRESFTGLNETLCDIIQYWDFFEDDDQVIMVPLTPKRLETVPIQIRMAILNSILGDIRPEALAPQTMQ